ncbi:hypothetical protein GF386_05110 [Candidatus Pacearchaeota archaeon]|nr:hypothetical protein [Candidatus Pacearchaeota archaeon]MBD3283490.1 hypothetical protein [Candidatus Pacearchaeota archaeon]
MRFSKKEIKDLLIAWLMISLAFAILFSEGNILSRIDLFFVIFVFSSLTAGIGFLFHELMHKFLAQKYRLWAEFRASYNMLFLAVIFSFFGFIIAAPGGVLIKGRLTREQNGRISLAGPLTNLVIALVFFIPLFILFLNNIEGMIMLFFRYGLIINSLLAVFNLIPFPGFDGQKVLSWNKTYYIITVILATGLFLTSFFI